MTERFTSRVWRQGTNTYVITITKTTRELLNLEEGDYLKGTIEEVVKKKKRK